MATIQSLQIRNVVIVLKHQYFPWILNVLLLILLVSQYSRYETRYDKHVNVFVGDQRTLIPKIPKDFQKENDTG